MRQEDFADQVVHLVEIGGGNAQQKIGRAGQFAGLQDQRIEFQQTQEGIDVVMLMVGKGDLNKGGDAEPHFAPRQAGTVRLDDAELFEPAAPAGAL